MQDTGLLEISPAKVRAFDGDEAINEPISYKLIDNGRWMKPIYRIVHKLTEMLFLLQIKVDWMFLWCLETTALMFSLILQSVSKTRRWLS